MSPDSAAASFQAIGSEARLSVLRTIVRAGDNGISVGDIQTRTGIAASTLSHHIRVLAESGVITQTRIGRSTMTTANYDHLNALADFILLECCADSGAVAEQKEKEEA